jgi:hypothetical protein
LILGTVARATNFIPQREQLPGADETTSGCMEQLKLFRDCALPKPVGAFVKASKAVIKRIPKVRKVLILLNVK